MDVASALGAFELLNRCALEIRLSPVMRNGTPDIAVTVIAHKSREEIGEVPPLGSSKFTLGAQGFRTMEAATLFGLYQIDFQLASDEFDKTKDG